MFTYFLKILGGGLFSPVSREMIQFDQHIFQLLWNHRLGLTLNWMNYRLLNLYYQQGLLYPYHPTTYLPTLGPQNHKTWRFWAFKIWVRTSRNEGFGFPWYLLFWLWCIGGEPGCQAFFNHRRRSDVILATGRMVLTQLCTRCGLKPDYPESEMLGNEGTNVQASRWEAAILCYDPNAGAVYNQLWFKHALIAAKTKDQTTLCSCWRHNWHGCWSQNCQFERSGVFIGEVRILRVTLAHTSEEFLCFNTPKNSEKDPWKRVLHLFWGMGTYSMGTRNLQFLGVITYNPYFEGSKPPFFHGFWGPRVSHCMCSSPCFVCKPWEWWYLLGKLTAERDGFTHEGWWASEGPYDWSLSTESLINTSGACSLINV